MAGANYGEELGTLVASGSYTPPTPSIEEVQQKQARERKDIDLYATQFTPVATTDAGVNALKMLMGDQTADKAQRAAAFEVINPGLQAGIGSSGELSLSAKPGSDLGFKYPVFDQQSTQGRAAGQANVQTQTLGNFEQQYKDIQGMEDPTKIAEAFAGMSTAAAGLVESRRNQLLAQVGQGLGIQDLESQMQADKVADAAYYNQYHRGQNMGPTDESMRTISLYNSARAQADAEVNRQLKMDPVLAGVESKMKILGMLVNSKLTQEMSGANQEKASTVALVGEDSIKAVALARGINYDAMKPVDKELIASQLLTGTNTATAISRDIAMGSSEAVATIAAGPASEQATQARRVFESRVGDPAVAQKIMDVYANFDNTIGKTLNKEQMDSLKIPATITSLKEKAQMQTQINQLKMGMVISSVKSLREQGFAQNAQSWELPQAADLHQEVKAVRESLLSSGKATVSIDEIVQRLDWTGSTPQAQAKIAQLADYIQSQAVQLPDNGFFGAPTMYANKDMAQRYVQALAVKAQFSARRATTGPGMSNIGQTLDAQLLDFQNANDINRYRSGQ